MKKIDKLMENKFLKILIAGIKTITSFLIIMIIMIIFIQRISNNKVTLFGYSMFTVVSESMIPKYQIFDMVIAKKVDSATISVGDDVVYLGQESTFKDKIVTHQVIKKSIKNGKFIFETKGIANDLADPIINEDQLYGKILFKSNLLSFLSKIVNNIYGFYFSIFVPFAILFFSEIFDINKCRKEKKKLKKKEELKDQNNNHSVVQSDSTIDNQIKPKKKFKGFDL